MRIVHRSLCLLTLVLAAGCASSGTSGSSSSSSGSLTREAMIQTGHSTVLDAISQLRPQWLTVRGSGRTGRPPEIVVFVDGARFGPVSSLRQITVNSVLDAEFLTAREAATRYGTLGGDGGVIAVRTR